MDHETEVSLIERVLAHIDEKSTHLAEEGAACAVSRYLDPAALEREMAALFRRRPLVVGHASQAAREGDYFTHDAAGLPIVVLKGREGGPRAFLNVCRHRGTRLVEGGAGCGKKAFVCPYHGWTYDTTGRLFHVPHEKTFGPLDRAALSMVPLPLESRFGLLWVTPTPSVTSTEGAAIDVGAYVGEAIGRDLSGFGLDAHVVYRPSERVLPFNWKLSIDVFLEAYHLKRVHEESIYPLFFDNLGLFDRFSPHLRDYFPKRSIEGLRGADRASLRARPHGNLLYHLFPNTLMLVQADHVSVFHVFPRGVAETTMLQYTLVPEAPATDKARRHWDRNIEILMSAVDEDLAMAASIQRGLASGANRELTFGRFEQALGYFHAAIEEAIR